MCCPQSTPVFKEKAQIYFPKLAKLLGLEKISFWVNKVSKNNYSFFWFLNEFLSENSEVEDTAKIKKLVLEHLKLLRKNFDGYFLEESENFRLRKRVINHFIFPLQQQELLDICNDIDLKKIVEKK